MYCLIVLQESNAMAIVDVKRAVVTGVYPLGFKDHSRAVNALDPSDEDGAGGAGAINIDTWPVFGMYQPDEIRSFRSKGKDYIVTANEGDSRKFAHETYQLCQLFCMAPLCKLSAMPLPIKEGWHCCPRVCMYIPIGSASCSGASTTSFPDCKILVLLSCRLMIQGRLSCAAGTVIASVKYPELTEVDVADKQALSVW
jgi:hypothetical protein